MAAEPAAAATGPPDADDDAAALRAALAGVRSRWDATHAASKAPFARAVESVFLERRLSLS